jgi:hypothetical protein
MLVPIYLSHAALAFEHRVAYIITTIMGCLLSPPVSTLGRQTETQLISGVILLGVVAGHSLESHWRKQHLHLHNMRQSGESQRESHR